MPKANGAILFIVLPQFTIQHRTPILTTKILEHILLWLNSHASFYHDSSHMTAPF